MADETRAIHRRANAVELVVVALLLAWGVVSLVRRVDWSRAVAHAAVTVATPDATTIVAAVLFTAAAVLACLATERYVPPTSAYIAAGVAVGLAACLAVGVPPARLVPVVIPLGGCSLAAWIFSKARRTR